MSSPLEVELHHRGFLKNGSARLEIMEETRLPGGNAGGAVLVGGTVRRPTGPWTPAVHALLRHLEAAGFTRAPRVLGMDEHDREVLTYLPGETIGTARPWPSWIHSDEALVAVGRWLADYHQAVADFVPPPDAQWRVPSWTWKPGDVVGHNDAAPYNAVWRPATTSMNDGSDELGSGAELVGFIDWDFAAPCPPIWDLAFVVFSWVPLHARDVVEAEGFTHFADRPRRLRLLLDAYGYAGTVHSVLDAVAERIKAHARDVRGLAAAGDPLFARLIQEGVIEGLDRALTELEADRQALETAP
jgi:Phosphotransferase enzyme family